MISLQDALSRYTEVLTSLPAQTRTLEAAHGQVLAAEVLSPIDLPLFDQSAVDGYALRAGDTLLASRLTPAVFPLAAVQAAGDGPSLLPAGGACRIFTGAMLPLGADSIARQEIVQRDADFIHLQQPLAIGADLRRRGEELRAGARLADSGQRLHAGLIAALAMSGIAEVQVRRRPRVSLLITGDELARAGAALPPGHVYDANGPLLRVWLASIGITQVRTQRVADTEGAVAAALEQALAESDLVISTGGVSVGDRDHIPAVAEQLGVKKVFWKVAQKPGKPLWFGVRNNLALLGLPGNPAAVLIGLALHVRRVLEVLEGVADPAPHWQWGVLGKPLPPDADRDRLLRMAVQWPTPAAGQVLAPPQLLALPRQASHMLSNLAATGALAWAPASAEALPAGHPLRWLPLFS